MLTGNDWDEVLREEIDSPNFKQLQQFLANEYAQHTIYPSMVNIYNALRLTPYASVKVVILGQDPYHGPGQAHGLSFSVQKGVPIPPSLQNIYKEMAEDIGFVNPGHGCLTEWAQQGVLLLNTVLTVRAGQAGSHRGMGWEQFTDAAIRILNEQDRPIVFLLWGRPAQMKEKMLNNPNHLILKAPHPSPLSAYRGFFGSKPFSKTNEFLKAHGVEPIDWQIENI